MTATQNDQTGRKKRAEPSAEAKAAVELVRAAKEQGLSLTGPEGLLRQLTKTVLETPVPQLRRPPFGASLRRRLKPIEDHPTDAERGQRPGDEASTA